MGIVHGKAVLVNHISVDSVVGDTTSCSVILDCERSSIVNRIFGVEQISPG